MTAQIDLHIKFTVKRPIRSNFIQNCVILDLLKVSLWRVQNWAKKSPPQQQRGQSGLGWGYPDGTSWAASQWHRGIHSKEKTDNLVEALAARPDTLTPSEHGVVRTPNATDPEVKHNI